MNHSIPSDLWLICPRCHAECLDRNLAKNEYLRCTRCGEEIKTPFVGRTIPAAWALSTTGLILMVLANIYPILSFSIAGNSQASLIVTGIGGLWFQGYGLLAVLVFSASSRPQRCIWRQFGMLVRHGASTAAGEDSCHPECGCLLGIVESGAGF